MGTPGVTEETNRGHQRVCSTHVRGGKIPPNDKKLGIKRRRIARSRKKIKEQPYFKIKRFHVSVDLEQYKKDRSNKSTEA